ncbi:hypothetical protein BGX29_002673 [Mortierella sp. GBA35]|nr:hypothetical protein BGX29_002668 [Mortierella sp. GBA35]KAF9103941.1 hypothetical protein BGX29_002673 [Mortierella sp. GBA35]
MLFKPTTIIFSTVAALMVVLSTVASTADAAHTWCVCNNSKSKSAQSCGIAGGNWDGGSCGLSDERKLAVFRASCVNLKSPARCWN